MNEDVKGVFAQALDDNLPPAPKADTDDLVSAGRRAVTRRRSLLSGGSVAAAVAVLALVGGVLQQGGPGGGNAADPSASSIDDPGADPGGILREGTIAAFEKNLPGATLEAFNGDDTEPFVYRSTQYGLDTLARLKLPGTDDRSTVQIWVRPIGGSLAETNERLDNMKAACGGELTCTIKDGPAGQRVLTLAPTYLDGIGDSLETRVYTAREDGTVLELDVISNPAKPAPVSYDQASQIALSIPLQVPGTVGEPMKPDNSADPDGALLAKVKEAVSTVLPGATLSANPSDLDGELRFSKGSDLAERGRDLRAKVTLPNGIEAVLQVSLKPFDTGYGTDPKKQLEMSTRCAGAEGVCTFTPQDGGEWQVTRINEGTGPRGNQTDYLVSATRPDKTIIDVRVYPWGVQSPDAPAVSLEQLTALLPLMPELP